MGKNRFHRGAPQLWKSGPISGLQGSERSGAFASMANPVVCSVLDPYLHAGYLEAGLPYPFSAARGDAIITADAVSNT